MNAHISMCWVDVAYPSNYTPALWVKNWKYFCYQQLGIVWLQMFCFTIVPWLLLGMRHRVAWEAAGVMPQNRPCGSEKRLEMVSMATEEQPLEKEM